MDVMQRMVPLAMKAIACEDCFGPGKACRAGINYPQPFAIGKNYERAPLRVAYIGLNPGKGGRDEHYTHHREDVFRRMRYEKDEHAYTHGLSEATAKDIRNWSAGDYLKQVAHLGLSYHDIVLGNIAICSTAKESHINAQFLRSCYMKHTREMLRAIDPHFVILFHSKIRSYETDIRLMLPNAEVVWMYHYKQRNDDQRAERQTQIVRVRKLLDAARREREAHAA